jgi:uroporphyrinogen decarboxylase
MTHKEILLSAIKLQKTPRLPVITLSSGVWTYYRYGYSLRDAFTLPPETAAEHLIKNNEEIDTDLIWIGADCNNVILHALGAECTFNIPGAAATVDKPLIKNTDDIDELKIDALENSPEINNLLNTARIVSERVGKEYLIGVSQWGPFTLAGQLMGIEAFMMTAARKKDECRHILEFTQRLALKYWKLFAEAGAELVCQAEPSASCDMISPKMFENTALPFIKGLNDEIGSAVKAKMLHICGNTTKILDLIPKTGTDLFSLDHKVDLSVVREKLNGKVAFAGQLDPVNILLEGNTEQIIISANECINKAGLEGGYVLMPGCDVPPKTKAENVKAMVTAAHNTRMQL